VTGIWLAGCLLTRVALAKPLITHKRVISHPERGTLALIATPGAALATGHNEGPSITPRSLRDRMKLLRRTEWYRCRAHNPRYSFSRGYTPLPHADAKRLNSHPAIRIENPAPLLIGFLSPASVDKNRFDEKSPVYQLDDDSRGYYLN